MKIRDIPYHELFNPTLQALDKLGGSGTNQEIHDTVAALLNLPDEQVELLHKSGQTALNYKLGWARTYLRHYGLLENSGRGVWALTRTGRSTLTVNPTEVIQFVSRKVKAKKQAESAIQASATTNDEEETAPSISDDGFITEDAWREELLSLLLNIDPSAFERLCQRILRKSGFTKVEVTQASRDGGIDGWGILQVNDFLSFRVEFQCKRYEGSVGPNVVQQLRGAMQGSVDRGLIITTGRFTKGARDEATRGDKVPIELVDGDGIIDRLKELELGVSTEMVPRVTVNPDFFANI